MKRTKKVNIDGPSLKIIPLGGLEQIGMNITAFEYEDSIVVVDCGLCDQTDDGTDRKQAARAQSARSHEA